MPMVMFQGEFRGLDARGLKTRARNVRITMEISRENFKNRARDHWFLSSGHLDGTPTSLGQYIPMPSGTMESFNRQLIPPLARG